MIDVYEWHRNLLAKQEQRYREWCTERGEDPETGTAARLYEEELAGMPIEEWWVEEQEARLAEQRHNDRDGGARL